MIEEEWLDRQDRKIAEGHRKREELEMLEKITSDEEILVGQFARMLEGCMPFDITGVDFG
jgi:hypothetical protein